MKTRKTMCRVFAIVLALSLLLGLLPLARACEPAGLPEIEVSQEAR